MARSVFRPQRHNPQGVQIHRANRAVAAASLFRIRQDWLQALSAEQCARHTHGATVLLSRAGIRRRRSRPRRRPAKPRVKNSRSRHSAPRQYGPMAIKTRRRYAKRNARQKSKTTSRSFGKYNIKQCFSHCSVRHRQNRYRSYHPFSHGR